MVQVYKPSRRTKGRQVKTIDVDIDGIDAQGQGVASEHKPVIFVPGALPGETWRVRVDKEHSNHWIGTGVENLAPSTKRQPPPCEYASRCGGCQTQHADTNDMLSWKQRAVDVRLRQFLKLEALPWQLPIHSDTLAYRRKARLSLDARNRNKLKLGFKGQGSNAVQSVHHCQTLLPQLQGLLPPLQSIVSELNSPQSLGHITLLAADNLTQVALRQVKPLSHQDRGKWQGFADQHGIQLWLEPQSGAFEWLAGTESQAYISPGQDIRLQLMPNDFVQVNGQVNQHMVTQAMRWLELSPEERVVDMFCGLGNFSLPLATLAREVLGLEVSTEMVQRAKDNARLNNISNAEFAAVDLQTTSALEGIQRADKVLLDPARAGARAVVEHMGIWRPKKILYVSCNAATFARDANVLLEQDYQLNKIGLMDMFPFTSHTELMALFSAAT